MIDTVRLICQAKPSNEQLSQLWGYSNSDDGKHYQCAYTYNEPGQVHATYRPVSWEKLDQFVLDFSLPKLVLGSNCEMISDLLAAIEVAEAKISEIQAFPPLPPLSEMAVSRLDVCCNHQVGALLPEYLAALAVLNYPLRDRVAYNGETVEFRAKSQKCKFYDKFAECGEDSAEGLLRHEVTLHRATFVKKALGFERPVTLLDVTPDRCRTILEQDLERLGILGRSFGTFDMALTWLTSNFGSARASRLHTIIDLSQRLSPAGIAAKLGCSKGSVMRSLSHIRKSGLPLGITKLGHALPALEVTL